MDLVPIFLREWPHRYNSFFDVSSGSVAWDLQLAGHKIEHGEQVLGGPIATGFALGRGE